MDCDQRDQAREHRNETHTSWALCRTSVTGQSLGLAEASPSPVSEGALEKDRKSPVGSQLQAREPGLFRGSWRPQRPEGIATLRHWK